MTTTANIGLEVLTEGQANKEASITASHQILDALVQASVIDRDLTSPPASPGPSEGDAYLVAPGASGDWSGRDGEIAHYRNSSWEFITPKEGFRLYVRDEDKFIIHDGSSWSTIGGSITVEESDGSPSVSGVSKVKVTNGKLTDNGGGEVTLDLSGSSGGSAIAGFQGIWEQIDRTEFSGSSSVTVGGGQIPGDYYMYTLLLLDLGVSTDGDSANLWASTNGGTSKITNYTKVGVYRRSSGADSNFANELATSLGTNSINTGTSNKPAFLKMEILSPASSKHKGFELYLGFPDNGTASLMYQQTEIGWIEDTAAIDSFVIEPSTGTITGIAVLLGLKKSETAGRLVVDTSLARSLSADDNNRLIHFTNGGTGVTVSVPNALPEGFSCRVINDTGGAITLSGSGGLTLLGDSSLAQDRAADICRIGNSKASVVSF